MTKELLCEPLLAARVGQEVNVPSIMGDLDDGFVVEVWETFPKQVVGLDT